MRPLAQPRHRGAQLLLNIWREREAAGGFTIGRDIPSRNIARIMHNIMVYEPVEKDGALVEDPVSGSLNAAIAPWLLRTGRTTAPYVVSQGTLLGRAGRVHVERDEDATIWVGGASVTCVSGEVEL